MTGPSGARERAELLPCPFCGQKPKVRHVRRSIIYCGNYDCFGPHTTAMLFEDAVLQWNTRPAPRPCAETAGGEEKIRLLCRMIISAGGSIDASDGTGNLLAYFCDDTEPVDTFNQASDRKLIRVTHDNRFDSSTATITDAGRAFATLSGAPTPPAETGPSAQDITVTICESDGAPCACKAEGKAFPRDWCLPESTHGRAIYDAYNVTPRLGEVNHDLDNEGPLDSRRIQHDGAVCGVRPIAAGRSDPQ